MDLTLPDINGEEATRRLKADPTTKDIPVIALTANTMASDREKAIAAGCDDFDTKTGGHASSARKNCSVERAFGAIQF
jgi:CheY-like chemotaxis protein